MNTPQKHSIIIFLKFGSEKNMSDLYYNGTIYLNSLEYFRRIEDNLLRGDKFEGASLVINSLPGTFRIPEINKTVQFEKVHFKGFDDITNSHLYCLYCVSSHGFENPLNFEIDFRNSKFGTHAVMIKNNIEFLKRIESALLKIGFKFDRNFVNYYDSALDSKENLTIFDKPKDFEYQKEFRFVVRGHKDDSIILNIGSLEEIAELHPISDILKLKLEPLRT